MAVGKKHRTQKEPAMKKVFISYSHKDSRVAEDVVECMARGGVGFAIDRVMLWPGDSLMKEIAGEIGKAAGVVAIISGSSVNSTWVQNELLVAKDAGLRIVPLLCPDAELGHELRLRLGDLLYVKDDDVLRACGLIPKVFWELLAPDGATTKEEEFLPILADPFRAPRLKVVGGTLEVGVEEHAFGRIAVVVPTNCDVYLGGKVSLAFFQYAGIDAAHLSPSPGYIDSHEVSVLGEGTTPGDKEFVIVASTVFNKEGVPRARDQWLAAKAVLDFAERERCTTIVVPPLGTGVRGRPRHQDRPGITGT
jgi:hypothetical protein